MTRFAMVYELDCSPKVRINSLDYNMWENVDGLIYHDIVWCEKDDPGTVELLRALESFGRAGTFRMVSEDELTVLISMCS